MRSWVLSVALEGLISKSVLDPADVDPEFVRQVDEAKPILKKIEIGERAMECVLSSLGNARRPRVQDALRRLVAKGVIGEVHTQAWKALRHAAAHGVMLVEDDDMLLQEHLDRYHVCLDLLYRLVFLLIGYTGKHVDYSTRDWPTRTLLTEGKAGGAAAAPSLEDP
jgi:hypothetical protein